MGIATRNRVIILLFLAFAALAWPAAAPAQTPAPSLRLVSPGGPVTLQRFQGQVSLDLGVWIAATGGDFELRVARPDYDSAAELEQVDAATGDVLRSLPSRTLDDWLGLRRFVTVVVKGMDGTPLKQVWSTWCPNGWDRQRIDDSGPELARYPAFCASSPFTRGMVWGIDSGWATSALGGFDSGVGSIRLPRDGKFIFDVRIAQPYAGLLDIAAEDAKVTLDVTVKNVRQPQCCEGRVVGRVAGAAGAARSLAVPDVDDPDPSTVPDLVALPLWSMTTFRRKSRDYLSFAATPWNAGPAPLVVEGFRRPGESVMDAYQYFREADGDVVGRAAVGEMAFHSHPQHNHWHFLQFAAFTLQDADDLEVVRSRKQAYCLAPTDAIDLTLERASFSPWEGLSTTCGSRGALWVREVLPTGWADTYFQGIPGQSFDITTLPNGWYQARMEVNPLGALYEVTTANNVESRLIHLGGRRGHRTVLATPWHGITD
jgi:lysyl oxidase